MFHNYYDQSLSKTATNISIPSTHTQFGTGKLSGHFITDDLRIGLDDDNVNNVGGNSLTWTSAKNSTNPLLIPNYHIGIVDSQEGIFEKFNVDAIVGMAYTYHQIGVKPFLNQVIEKKVLKENIFAYYYTSNQQAKDNNLTSEMTFGYYDKTKFKGKLRWYPVDYQ